MIWIKDEDFIRDKVPMTKFDIRVLSCVTLNIKPGDTLLDIGAGTGSVSIQAAKLGAEVVSVESNPEAIKLIEKNASKFATQLDLLHGFAPNICPDKMFDAVFIGGNKGRMGEIIQYIKSHLKPSGVVVCNFVTLKNATRAKDLLEENGFDVDTKLIQVAQEDRLGILRGQNPIFIIRGEKR